MEEERMEQPRRRRKPKSFFRRLLELPKKTLLTLVAILVVFVAVIVIISKSCSAVPDTTVTAQAFSTQTELKLPLSVKLNEGDYLSYGGYQFETSKKIASLVKTINKNNDGVTATSFTNAHGTCYLFTKQTETGVDHWALYPKDIANYYIFMGTHREVALDGSRLDILLPLHLVSDSALMDNMGGQIQLDTSYACGYDGLKEGETLAALFRAYYEESGLYTVTSSDGGFTIVPKGSDKTLIFTFQEDGTSGMFAVSAAVGRETEQRALALIRDELDRFRTDGVTQTELDRAREQVHASVLMAEESTAARMNKLGYSELYLGRVLSADEVLARYDAVTCEDILGLARETLDFARVSFSAVGRLRAQEEYEQLLKG